MQEVEREKNDLVFTGNIFLFHAFDVGDDINLERIERLPSINSLPFPHRKYFKNYHLPLVIELPHPHATSRCSSCKIHNFGAISLTYKVPFTGTLQELRSNITAIENQHQEQSVMDVKSVFKKIKSCIAKPKFFQTRASYLVIQIDPQPDKISLEELKKDYGNIIVSAMRFETETLSDYQKNEILKDAIGYFRGELIIIDTDASFVYDAEYEETLEFFEFANIQQLELRYFDRLLDQQLNAIYEGKFSKLDIKSYLPFIGLFKPDPVTEWGRLKADISVITERLESSIKLVGEPYFSELYERIVDTLDLQNWQNAINKKLEIVREIQQTYQHKIDAVREDMLTISIIILIFIELIVGFLSYLK